MQPRLFIRLKRSDDTSVETLSVGADGDTAMQEGELSVLAAGCRVIVIVPATDLLLTRVTVPSRNRQRILSAVPFLLEDQLASDVELLHFVIGAPDSNGEVPTLVVEHHRMEKWLALLKSNGIEPHMMIADLSCLPQSSEHGWTVVLEEEAALVACDDDRGFAVDRDNLPLMLRGALRESADSAIAPQALRLIPVGEEREVEGLEALCEKQGVTLNRDEVAPHALTLLAQHFDEKRTLNLLQGQYSRREQIGKMLRPWRAAAAMLVALMLFSGGMTVVDYFELSDEKVALQQHIDKTYLAACPGAKRVVNARVQMEQCLKKLRGGESDSGEGMLDMLASIGDALKAAGGLQLQRLSYRSGQLDMALAINDIQGLDQLKQRIIKESGFQVEILSATSRNNRIEARVQLKGSGA